MERRSDRPKPWFIRAFLVGWGAAALYMFLVVFTSLLGIPWHPILGLVGVVLLSLFIFGFFAVGVGMFLYQVKNPPKVPSRVVRQGKEIGWIVDPVADENGDEIGRWQPAYTPEAREFLTTALSTPDEESLVMVNGVKSWIQLYSDDSDEIWVRWRVSDPFESSED